MIIEKKQHSTSKWDDTQSIKFIGQQIRPTKTCRVSCK